jgi:hypothetical protein
MDDLAIAIVSGILSGGVSGALIGEVCPGVEREAKGGAGGQRYHGASEHDRERSLGDPAHGPGDQGHRQRR